MHCLPPKLQLIDLDILTRHRHHFVVVHSRSIAPVNLAPAERLEDTSDDFFFRLEFSHSHAARMEDGVSCMGKLQTRFENILAATEV